MEEDLSFLNQFEQNYDFQMSGNQYMPYCNDLFQSQQSYFQQRDQEKKDSEETTNSSNNKNNNNTSNSQIKICSTQNIEWLVKSPQEQSIFLMYGDFLIETQRVFDDVDYMIKLCNTYLQKKRVVFVNYDKIYHLIEMKSENLFQGNTNFEYVTERLRRTQNNKNFMLAEQMHLYQQKISDQRLKYEKIFEGIDENELYYSQQCFFEQMKAELLTNIINKDEDFYSYLFYSYLDKLELGFPVQKQQGINEATCALFGCDSQQLIELMSRYGYVEQIFKRGFDQEIVESEPFSHIFMMTNLDYFVQMRDLFDQEMSIMTVDGIYVKIRMIVKQVTQVYNGLIISNFYYSKYIVDDEDLKRLLSIRFSGTHVYSSKNILDLLLNQNIYATLANKFGNYISNHKNFEPPLEQDLNPDRTCKYRYIQ